MLLVKTYLDRSHIEGIGVFAAEFIEKGRLIWTFQPPIDKILTETEITNLPQTVQAFIQECSYLSNSGNYYLFLDNAMYINTNDTPNVSAKEPYVALKDIEAQTELTISHCEQGMDYRPGKP